MGGSEPVRVEIGLRAGAQLANDERLARNWARSLLSVPELVCESVLIEIGDEAELLALPRLASALGAEGLETPISIRIPVSLAPEALSSPVHVARWVVDVARHDGFKSLSGVVEMTKVLGAGLEWCLNGEPADLGGGLDRVLQASGSDSLFAISLEMGSAIAANRLLLSVLEDRGAADVPIVLRYGSAGFEEQGRQRIAASIQLGSLLCDGIGDMLSMRGSEDPGVTLDLAYRILQAARLRTTRTEYISCPSCGRTLFDLEETTARIKQTTAHLKGVKIAVMGCIVNGPGEMADADFGYVGSGPGVVTLYVGKQVVARNIPEVEAPDRLTELIQEHGLWQEA